MKIFLKHSKKTLRRIQMLDKKFQVMIREKSSTLQVNNKLTDMVELNQKQSASKIALDPNVHYSTVLKHIKSRECL